ncbi:MAG TPA: YegP family protein [Ligilactobacillus acidipiscis]|uniref:YegP family protein n=1 Tax=Ligilactobacillus acidipiscis TaxID=89059 RepID=A0A921JZM1_9LACO|nr:YegP family protein [Ligilactobacillus acidipiscis]
MYFVIRKATNGQFYFVLKAGNNEVVATSETYFYKESAVRTISSIKNEVNSTTDVIDTTK